MQNEVEYPHRESKPIDETDNDLCRALWISVIVQAMIDLGAKSPGKEHQHRRSEVIQWLGSNPEEREDFETVCSMAGVDSSEVRRVMKGIIRGTVPHVDFRATKKALVKNREREDRRRYFRRARKNQRLKLAARNRERKTDDSGGELPATQAAA